MKSILLIIILLLLATPTLAQDESDNECYAGGRLENQCDTEDLWTYGYYLHRHLEYGEPMPARYLDSAAAVDFGLYRYDCGLLWDLLRGWLSPAQFQNYIAVNGCWISAWDWSPFNPPIPPDPIVFPYCPNEPDGVCPHG